MKLRSLLFVVISIFCFATAAMLAEPLDIGARTRSQRAIEEVYWGHRIWPEQNNTTKPSLDALISADQLQEKAQEGLRLSNALQTVWHQPIAGSQLQSELQRMAHDTRQPEVLRELFAALDNNPRTIAETLARPLLAERLARSFYQADSRFSAKTQPFEKWWSNSKAGFSPELSEPDFNYVLPHIEEGSGINLAANSWFPTHDLPDGDLSMSAVWTGTEMIIWGGFKGSIGAIFNTGSRYNPATDTWHSVNNSAAPVGKMQHTAVWTGKEMIVWGGCDENRPEHACESNIGSRFNPATDSWTPTTLNGAPTPRINHQAVWTGTEMVVWGGCAFFEDVCHANQVGTTGGRYNPSSDSWTATSTANAPVERTQHTAVWTGAQMIVWGGVNDNGALSSGGVYLPSSDTWTPTAPLPPAAARYFHTEVWDGTEMIVWGGTNGTQTFNNGGLYNPTTNRWRPVALNGAPSPRSSHTAIWTGTEMVVWAGANGNTFTNTGGRYNPNTNTWKPTSSVNAPPPRQAPVSVWTGSLMVVWGGQNRTGGRYDPASDSWTPTSSNEAPSARTFHTAVWTGTEMIVWGGDDAGNGTVNTGSRYRLATDSWAATALTNAPSARHEHSALWTGTEMIIWGGAYGSNLSIDGGRYNPTSDSWKATSNSGAPEPRALHSAVWTGSEMIVFGGSVENAPWTNTGGRYNPSTNSWKATTTSGAPSPRELAAAVWAGSEMIVWGGATSNFDTNTGGRYNPSTNSWTPTTQSNAPSARDWMSYVWTGSRMLIWGGQTYSGVYNYHNDGALYDPASDSWTPTNLTGAPGPRAFFGYVWSGTELIVWSGCTTNSGGACSSPALTGGRYNPATDAWRPTNTKSAPSARSNFPAVWTGNRMIVWSGVQGNSILASTGGIYTPGP
jgi:N-acetylneuraminic acid mutarotase